MKYEAWFTLISEKRKVHFSISSLDELDFGYFILEFAAIFKGQFDEDNHHVNIEALQKNDHALRENIKYYVDKYKNENPKINRLNDFIKSLTDEESFYILPVKDLTQPQHIEVTNELMCINGQLDYAEFNSKVGNLMRDFYSKYSIDGVDPKDSPNKKIKIGEPFKLHRVCRFCKNTRETVTTYNVEAHAISESLGNKKIILNEECDACNTHFGKTIERDIYNFLSMYLVAFGVKNSNNKPPKIKGSNFHFFAVNKDEQEKLNNVLKFTLDNDEDKNGDKEPPKELMLSYNSNVSLQNIYKALVKYAISVVHEKESLKGFEKTIEWISSNTFYPQLPKIAMLKSYKKFSKEPSLIIYRRNNDDREIPFAFAEFSFTFLTFVFIIPTFHEEETDFTIPSNFNRFWDFVIHYSSLKGWLFEDFSDAESKPFRVNMTLNRGNSDIKKL